MRDDVIEFAKNFNIVDNALQMRTLKRWNGRDLRESENLSEHTHLVICCIYDIITHLKSIGFVQNVNYYSLIKKALLHDSLELLRGDILTITKDAIPGLRDKCDEEELDFMTYKVGDLKNYENDILRLADLMACYKFVEWELRYPSNEFAKNAYIETKKTYDKAFHDFCIKYNLIFDSIDTKHFVKFSKGYEDDAGVDILLQEDVTFMPMSTMTYEFDIQITPNEGEMAFLCARTSAANKGLSVATCPIDPHYNGKISAIVHNLSNNIITYKKGEAFCQYVTVKIIPQDFTPRKQGLRSDSKLGGTGKC